MKYEINALFEPDIVWAGEINRQTMRLERKLAVLPPSNANLECSLWRDAERASGVGLTLDLGDVRLSEKAVDSSEVMATKKAFDALNHQVEAHLNRLRERDFWSRTSRNRGEKESNRAAFFAPASKHEAAEAIDRHLSDLYNFVRREIAGRQALGDLLAGELTPEEIVDETAVAAIERFDSRPADLKFEGWLWQLALDAIRRRAEEIKIERETLMRLEDDGWAATSAAAACAAEDEIYEYYQPDERLRLEDLIADERVPTPEETVARRDLQQYVNQTLASLPRRWREAFVLYSVEGKTLEETARVLRLPVDAVRRNVEMAREYLRERLIEAGVARPAADQPRTATAAAA
jgi:RNA polymerase sigma factor (sigma-70 family)